LKSYIIIGDEKTINYNSEPVNLQITSPASISSGKKYYIHSKSHISDKNMLIAGTHAIDKQKTAFAALVDSAGAVKWLKEFKQTNTDSHALLTALLNDGYAVVISSKTNGKITNRILLLDANGNTKTSKDLPISSVPQKMIYDDIAQTYILAFKGDTYMPYHANSDIFNICMLNSKLETVWSNSLFFDGYLANVVKTDDNFYIYGAYSKLTTENGKTYNTNANRVNMFVCPISADGKWMSVTVFEEPFSYYPIAVSKINNEYVDVISVKDKQPDKLIEDRNVGGMPYYLIIRSNSERWYPK